MLGPLQMRDLGTIEQHILSERESPLKLATAALPGILDVELQKHLLSEALKQERQSNHVAPDELEAFLDSRRGLAFTLWLMLRREQADATLELAESVLNEASEEEFKRLLDVRDQAAGLDASGNLTGRPRSEQPTPAQTGNGDSTVSEPIGAASSASSASTTKA